MAKLFDADHGHQPCHNHCGEGHFKNNYIHILFFIRSDIGLGKKSTKLELGTSKRFAINLRKSATIYFYIGII